MSDDDFGFGGDEEFDGFGDADLSESQPEEPPKAPAEPQKPPTPQATNASSSTHDDDETSNLSSSVEGLSVTHSGHGHDVRATRSGWLTMATPKKTLSRKGGKKERYFCLENDTLWYASTPTSKHAGEYAIAEVTSVQEHEGQPTQFTVVTASKSLHLIAKTEEDATNWILSIRKAQKSNTSADFGSRSTGSALLF